MSRENPGSPIRKVKNGARPRSLPAGSSQHGKKGYLEKQNQFGFWQRRFFKQNGCFLEYYRDDKQPRRLDCTIDLKLVSLVKPKGKIIELFLHDPKKMRRDHTSRYKLRASGPGDAKLWATSLREAHVHGDSPMKEARAANGNGAQLTTPNGMRAEEAAGGYNTDAESGCGTLLGRCWLAVVFLTAISSIAALLPMPSLSLWFIKVGILCGVLHANVLKVYGLMVAISLAGLLLSASPSHVAGVSNGPSKPRTKPRVVYMGSLVLASAAAGVMVMPTLLALPQASRLPAEVSAFLTASGLDYERHHGEHAAELTSGAETCEGGRDAEGVCLNPVNTTGAAAEDTAAAAVATAAAAAFTSTAEIEEAAAALLETATWPFEPFSFLQYLTDPPCALSNGSEFKALSETLTYKTFTPEKREGPAEAAVAAPTMGDLSGAGSDGMKGEAKGDVDEPQFPPPDWSGLGGLYEGHAPGRLDLTIFRPPAHAAAVAAGKRAAKKDGLLPVLVSLHGGGWYSGSMYDGLQCYLSLALNLEFAVVTSEYRLGQRGWRGRDMVADVLDLLKWIRVNGEKKGLDKDKIIIMGGSAGAHLAMTASYLLNKDAKKLVVKGVVARYGATDLAKAWAHPQSLQRGWSERKAIEHITGGDPTRVASEYSYLSPVHHVGPHTPPTVLLHCRQDEFYSWDVHVDGMKSSLIDSKVPHLIIDPALHSHGCDIGSTAPFQFVRYTLSRFLTSVKDTDFE
mmetsp:Transcript_7728/g.18437  ORF Transcript_7728/g.18437 Transcript_7728/m.18437 type:complete len:739 (-) Transcript_7728:345-2561(-)